MYYNGIYHLFYQYNPKGAVWGNIVWAHSVSKDLINWQRLENAIYPSKPFDKYGCWSGSATVLPGNKPIILYTGIIDQNNTQVQNYAVPANLSDPYLRHWVKPDNNPLIVSDESINKTAFRDPATAWMGRGGRWRISIGGRRKHRGIAYLYRSKDFIHWAKAQHPLHTSAGTGNWECPDFFPVSVSGKNGLDTSVMGSDVKHVLKVSLDVTRYEYYTLGTYFTKNDRYVPDENMVDGWNGLRYDYGNFYASKSFFDPSKNRRILWGWANESDATVDDVKKGWAGIQGENRNQRNNSFTEEPVLIYDGCVNMAGRVDVTFSFDSLDKAEPFDQAGTDTMHRSFAAKRVRPSSLKDGTGAYRPSFAGFVDADLTGKKLSLRSLIDNSVVESFGAGGKTCISSRVYPTLAIYGNAHLYAFNNGTQTVKIDSLNAWSMNSPPLMNQ
ncbi:hypothetical protein DH2020_039812 [Rehmannia glutinosa]|uniref:Beta-fructofuranosidase n=1 Tax=Rehmannia glutinosa TaxID=99300 RepID=A0ABR0UUP7_REHGL